MAGYRFGTERLTTDLPPWPINPYGHSKLYGERAGRSFAEQSDFSFIAFRIGWCQRDHDNRPEAVTIPGFTNMTYPAVKGRWWYASSGRPT